MYIWRNARFSASTQCRFAIAEMLVRVHLIIDFPNGFGNTANCSHFYWENCQVPCAQNCIERKQINKAVTK